MPLPGALIQQSMYPSQSGQPLHRAWVQFFDRLASVSGGAAAPATAFYIVSAANALLPNARVTTNTATISFDTTTVNVLKANVVDHSIGIQQLHQQFMPVFVGGLAVTIGNDLLVTPWDTP